MLIDSHCHLSSSEIYADLDQAIKRANDAGICGFLNAASTFNELDVQLEICSHYPNVWTLTGVHPHDALAYQHITLENVLSKTEHPKVVGIGECGLDYFYNFAPKDVQQNVFKTMIKAAQISSLPLVVHTRDADEDTILMLKKAYNEHPFKGVIHCFSSSENLAFKMIDIGFYISVSGMVTFQNAQTLRKIIQKIPLDRLLVETDTPYLAPVPMRGKTNEPSFVVYTARMLAELKSVSFEKIADITTKNFFNLFDKAKINE